MNCYACGIESGTKVVCDECAPHLTAAQDRAALIIWHKIIVERDGNECVYCGHSSIPEEDGELCGNHTRGRILPFRFDTAAGECVCKSCNDKFSSSPAPMKRQKPPEKGHKPKIKKAICPKCRIRLAITAFKGLCIVCKR